ncbi:MAG: cytochrome c3 family protein [Planctomycetota bacterium]
MIGRGLHRLVGLSAIGFFSAAMTGALLLAQAREPRSNRALAEEQPPRDVPRPAAATSQPSSHDPANLAAREHLISGLIGSKHDFTRIDEDGRGLCLPCHTPHLVAAPVPRLDRRSTTPQPLRPYQGISVELTGWSLLCLGCHDGITAPDVYSSAHAVTITDQLANSHLGTVGLRSHPVGIKYPLAAEDYHPRAAVEAGGLILPDGRIQCTTCHDAHNTHRHQGMLRISNEHSRVCLTCHRR